MTSDDPISRRLSAPIEAALEALVEAVRGIGSGDEDERKVEAALNGVREAVRERPLWLYAETMASAPRDGTSFLVTGIHRGSSFEARHGVKAGDRWWGIALFDTWGEARRFVFAKDGKALWSDPELWCPLPELLPGDRNPRLLPAEMTPEIGEALVVPHTRVVRIAKLFRDTGTDIAPDFPAEHAFVLFWRLVLALEHGEKWRLIGQAELDALDAKRGAV